MSLNPNFLLGLVREFYERGWQVAPGVPYPPLLHVQDEKAQNTAGGTFTSGAWRTRDNNAVKTNEIAGASLAGNQFTLPVGTFWIEWRAPAHSVAAHKTKLVDVTNTADILFGSSCQASSTQVTQTDSGGFGRFTSTGSAAYEIQHECQVTQATNGLGVPGNFAIEIYTAVRIWKVG